MTIKHSQIQVNIMSRNKVMQIEKNGRKSTFDNVCVNTFIFCKPSHCNGI